MALNLLYEGHVKTISAVILSVFIIFSVSSGWADEQNFKCAGYSIAEGSPATISKLEVDRNGGMLDGEILEAKALDGEIDSDMGFKSPKSFLYQYKVRKSLDDKASSVQVGLRVQRLNKILELGGQIGPRNHDVNMFSATLTTTINAQSRVFNGTCTTISISTCVGIQRCPDWEKWQIDL